MDLGQLHPRDGIGRVDADRLVQESQALVDFVGPAALRPPAGSEIELVGLRVARAADVRKPRERFKSRLQRWRQRVHDAVGDLVLHFEHAGELLVEGAAPGCGAVARMQKTCCGTHQVAIPLQRAVHDPGHLELPGRADRVTRGIGVALHGPDGAHHQPRHRGEPRDQAVGHPELERLVPALGRNGLEGENGEACRRGSRRRARQGPPGGAAQNTGHADAERQPKALASGRIAGLRIGNLHRTGQRRHRIGQRRACDPLRCVVAHDRGDKAESVARNSLDEAAALGVVTERPPQSRHHLAQVVLFDHQAWPERLEEAFLVEKFARVLDEE
jgi:hypothetical protein